MKEIQRTTYDNRAFISCKLVRTPYSGPRVGLDDAARQARRLLRRQAVCV